MTVSCKLIFFIQAKAVMKMTVKKSKQYLHYILSITLFTL